MIVGDFPEESESHGNSCMAFSGRGDQIPGIGDGELPVVPSKTGDTTDTGQLIYVCPLTQTTESVLGYLMDSAVIALFEFLVFGSNANSRAGNDGEQMQTTKFRHFEGKTV